MMAIVDDAMNSPWRNDRPETAYFSDLAELYDAYRPSYPAAAIDAILDDLDRPIRVASIGSGTGICCRLLAARDVVSVVGVEPDDAMRKCAERASAAAGLTIDYRKGTSETTGLDDESIDVIVCAQCYHWFDPEQVLPEFAHVLRSKGRLALMWNRSPTDLNDPVRVEYDAVVRAAQDAAESAGQTVPRGRSGDPAFTGHFTNCRSKVFSNPQTMTEEALIGRLRSSSYFPTSGPLRDELLGRARSMFSANENEGVIVLPQETNLVTADRVE